MCVTITCHEHLASFMFFLMILRDIVEVERINSKILLKREIRSETEI